MFTTNPTNNLSPTHTTQKIPNTEYSAANFNHLLLYQDQLITYSPKRTIHVKFNCPGLLGCRKEKPESIVWRMGARIPREAGRLLTISELAELKDFKIKYRTDNTKDEKFFVSSYSILFQGRCESTGNRSGQWIAWPYPEIAEIERLQGSH